MPYFTRVGPDKKWSIATISGLELNSFHFRVLIQTKPVMTPYFTHCCPLPTGAASEACRYFHGKCSNQLYSFLSHIQMLPAEISNNRFTQLHYSYSFRIPIVRRKYHSKNFFKRTNTLWKNTGVYATKYVTSCPCSIVIYHP